MIKVVNHWLHVGFKQFEVEQESVFLQFISGKSYTHAIVVTMRVLTASVIIAQVMAGGKICLYGNFKHAVSLGVSFMMQIARHSEGCDR